MLIESSKWMDSDFCGADRCAFQRTGGATKPKRKQAVVAGFDSRVFRVRNV